MATKIRGVLFDIGGVIVRTDNPASRLNLAQRYGLDRDGIDRLVFASPAALAVERGEAEESALWEHVRRTLDLSAAGLEAFQREFWAGETLDRSLLELIRALHGRVRTGLLTNNWMADPLPFFERRFGLPVEELNEILDVVVSSAQVGARKPDPRIFHFALQKLGTLPEETIFVDDFAHNVSAARELGLVGILFESSAQTRRDVLARIEA